MISIIALAFKATLVILCAFVIAAIARRRRASTRHGIFAALFVTLLVLPAAPRLIPAATTVELPAAFATPPPAVPPAVAFEDVSLAASPVDAPSPAGFDFLAAARNVYIAGVVLLLAHLAAGVWRLRRWANDAEIWLEGTRLAAGVAFDNGIRRAVLVVMSNDVAVPLTFGFRRHTIVMPAAVAGWTAESVRRAIRHELEHVRRDDWALQLVARIGCAVYWPHPMVWAAFRRFCLEAERACDDAVVQASDAPTYAEQLVTLARTLDRPTAAPALAMASRSRLSERVHAILDPRQLRGPQSRTAVLVTISVMIAFVVTFGSVQVVDAAAAISDSVTGDAVSDGVREGVDGALDEDDLYREAVVEAAARGDIEALQFFASRGVDLERAIIGDGTPLLIAARAGRTRAVLWLLDRGADPNEPSRGDGNALIAAAGAGETGIMKLLLARGARIEDVVEGDENALITAAANGREEAVRLLIERGANVNSRVWANDREWRTPLNMARRNGHRDIVRTLIAAGARE